MKRREKKGEKIDAGENFDKGVANVGEGRNTVSRRVALHRVKKALPRDPKARAETVEDLRASLGFTKEGYNMQVRQLFRNCGRKVIREIAKHLLTLDKKSKCAAQRMLNISRQNLNQMTKTNSFYTRVLRKSSKGHFEIVNTFLKQNSTISSEKKHVTSKGLRMLLKNELLRLYKKFCDQQQDIKIGKSFFYICRPKNTKLAQSGKLNQCLCKTCTNLGLKVKALKPACPELPTSKKILVDAILCRKTGAYHEKACIFMDCPLCGPDKLLLQFVTTQKCDKVFCEQWETEVVEKKSKKVLTKKEYLVKDLIKELIQDLKNYPQHIFTATWQYQQFNTMRNCVGDDEVVMVYDFAENYRSAYQDEPQSAHWNCTQITIQPVVCYYRCSCNG